MSNVDIKNLEWIKVTRANGGKNSFPIFHLAGSGACSVHSLVAPSKVNYSYKGWSAKPFCNNLYNSIYGVMLLTEKECEKIWDAERGLTTKSEMIRFDLSITNGLIHQIVHASPWVAPSAWRAAKDMEWTNLIAKYWKVDSVSSLQTVIEHLYDLNKCPAADPLVLKQALAEYKKQTGRDRPAFMD